MAKDIFIAPMYIRAKSKDLLVQAMIANNLKWNATFEYFDIQKDGKEWVCWYYHNFRDHKIPRLVNFDGGGK